MKKAFGLVLSFLLINSQIFSQDSPTNGNSSENWVTIENSKGQRLEIDISGIENYRGDDFYVWVIQENIPPFELEDIDEKIYKTKTYYLMHKSFKKYSLIELIFYDQENNVLKSFNYKDESELPEYKYSYPIYKGTDQELIYQECLKKFESSQK